VRESLHSFLLEDISWMDDGLAEEVCPEDDCAEPHDEPWSTFGQRKVDQI
jgi:hypothetical protein